MPKKETQDALSMLEAPTNLKQNRLLILGIAIAVVALAIAALFLSSQVGFSRNTADDAVTTSARNSELLARAQADTCGQIRNIKKELNRRIRAHSVDRAVLLEALRIAARGPNNRLRHTFAHLRNIEREKVNFVPLKIPDCEARLKQLKLKEVSSK